MRWIALGITLGAISAFARFLWWAAGEQLKRENELRLRAESKQWTGLA